MDFFASHNSIFSIFSEPETETQPTTPVDSASRKPASGAPFRERFFSRSVLPVMSKLYPRSHLQDLHTAYIF
jgi:hypothetical protein